LPPTPLIDKLNAKYKYPEEIIPAVMRHSHCLDDRFETLKSELQAIQEVTYLRRWQKLILQMQRPREYFWKKDPALKPPGVRIEKDGSFNQRDCMVYHHIRVTMGKRPLRSSYLPIIKDALNPDGWNEQNEEEEAMEEHLLEGGVRLGQEQVRDHWQITCKWPKSFVMDVIQFIDRTIAAAPLDTHSPWYVSLSVSVIT
jgi:hypothetical protein